MKTLLAVLAAVALFLAVNYYIMSREAEESARILAAQKAEREDAAARAALNEMFESLLNEFLRSVNAKAAAYKVRRCVLEDLTNPSSLRNSSYVEENYRLMVSAIPELHARMDEIMNLFGETEKRIGEILSAEPDGRRKPILESWGKLKDRQAKTYIAFFNAEQEILSAYQELMRFYYSRRGAMAYDASTDSIIFREPAARVEEKELRRIIQAMEAREAEMLGGTEAERNAE